ncbi:MAG TPA: hypothetical protein VK059_09630 [Nocardioidaceae bacterium]|nr:hypothetical protein [Nocardioidaceae bacterium]
MTKVFLHVGAPKTGTSMVQELLYNNRKTLAEHGILYPGRRRDAHFLAALDLLERTWGGLEVDAPGSWDYLVGKAQKWDDTVVISHEVFAGASEEQAKRAISSLEGCDVHIVYTARDLTRQIPAEWQEQVKHRKKLTYSAFLSDLAREESQSYSSRWFWAVHEWPDVLRRWSVDLPEENVHLVTVPPPGAPRALLIDRLLSLWGIEQDWLTKESHRANVSLGAVETTVIRKINKRNPPTTYDGPYYREWVRELLAHRTLAGREGARRLILPPDQHDWARDITTGWIDDLRTHSYDVRGDLEELRVIDDQGEFVDPDAVDSDDQLDIALDVIDTLLAELVHERERGAGAAREAEERGEQRVQEVLAAAKQRRGRVRRFAGRVRRKLRF